MNGEKSNLVIGMIVGDDLRHLQRNLPYLAGDPRVRKVALVSVSNAEISELLGRYGFELHRREFTDYSEQRNHLLSFIGQSWVLMLDADERPEPMLIEEAVEIAGKEQVEDTVYMIPRKTEFMNRFMLHGGLYPDYRPCLFYNRAVHYECAVHERLVHDKPTRFLRSHILHYSDDGLAARLYKVVSYSAMDAASISKRPHLLEVLLRPIGYFSKRLVVDRAWLDGIPGMVWLVQATVAYLLKYLIAYYRFQLYRSDPKAPLENPAQGTGRSA